ncbi:hypothetical protein GWI33_018598 [Rhynchophorus ferrugineus]|uniref:Uncharacterized protein n=1 Tax=Rhynchophorus ferrugineus TaxID=354439 RepID=A0A834HT16_RHYFE|nr:hypothetical protein GWI33_018598 [Rhynchophorus ferrugineus]
MDMKSVDEFYICNQNKCNNINSKMEKPEIILFSIIGVFVLILLICVGVQFYIIKKLFKRLSVLDPISSYKKM